MNEAITIHLGLGSNLNDRMENLREALRRLSGLTHVVRVSSIYETAPVGLASQPDFLNAVLEAETTLPPEELLKEIKRIELDMGRVPSVPNGPRLIDIDILLYGEMTLETPSLSIPHPRMHERAFVLVPLCDIAPDQMHPTHDLTISQLLARMPDTETTVRLSSQQL